MRETATSRHYQIGIDEMKFRNIIKLIESDGWRLVKQRGSHRQFKHSVKTGKVTVAGHPSAEAAPKTLRSILERAGLQK